MKRYEVILKKNITGYRGSIKQSDAIKMMQEIAWEAWRHLYDRNHFQTMESSAPGVSRLNFEMWWNEKINEA